MNIQHIPLIKHTDSGNFFLLAGPCAIEGEEMAMRIAEKLVGITDKLEIPFVFKGSFKKANRSRIDSFSGIGDEKAKALLIHAFAYDVTEQINARNLIEANGVMINNIYMNAPASICTFKGPTHIYELVNPAYQKLFDNRNLVGKLVDL